jgi:PAS domain S-box-containing protein
MAHKIPSPEPPRAELEARLRQQAAIATLSQHALSAADLDRLLSEAVGTVAAILHVECTEVLELLPEGTQLLLRAGVGWSAGEVGRATESCGTASQAGYTLRSGHPVVVSDLHTEGRFGTSARLREHGIVSGLSVPIRGRNRPYGVLGAHSRALRTFTPEDAHFLEGVANLLAQAIERHRVEESLRQAQESLGQRVAERTRELEQANAQLVQEVTERKRAEEELRASEARFRVVFEQAAVGIGLVAPDATVIEANPALQAILERSAEELHGASILQFAPPGTRLDLFHRIMEGEQIRQKIERRYQRRDGEWADLEVAVSVVRGADGGAQFAILLVEDVTERKRVADEMRKLSHAVEQTADFVMITDRNGVIEYVNSAFQALTGWTREEAVGRTPRILRSGAHSAGFYERLWRTILQGAVFRSVFVNRTRDGRLFHEEKTITPLKDRNGVITHFISTGRDITERKHAEEQARRHQAELAHVARLSTMGEMASGLAHELNQPLAAIMNYTQGTVRRMRSGTASHEELLAALEQVRIQAERAGEIIRRLRNFVRKGDPQRTLVDVNTMVREVLDLVEPDLRRHDVRLRLELTAGLPKVLADTVQIEQVILNLVLNGQEAMEAVPRDRREILIRSESPQPDTVAVWVHDTGPGLSAQTGEQAFDPFFTTKPKGMGMGLSISRTIVEAHGGRLVLVPGTTGGATFQFTLPALEAEGTLPG